LKKVVCPIDSRVDVNERESSALSSLRDALLPKLIPGELRLREAETLIEGGLMGKSTSRRKRRIF
jgi:type I restriction enzyme S subunit